MFSVNFFLKNIDFQIFFVRTYSEIKVSRGRKHTFAQTANKHLNNFSNSSVTFVYCICIYLVLKSVCNDSCVHAFGNDNDG